MIILRANKFAMLFLILSIICSVTVGVLFKVSRRYSSSPIQIVAWNYVFALVLCYFFFSPNLNDIGTSAPWGIYVPIGVLLPTIFLFFSRFYKTSWDCKNRCGPKTFFVYSHIGCVATLQRRF